MKKVILTVILLFLTTGFALAQTTGKIAGTVIDADTDEPILGANVFLAETTMGAATNLDGSFYIINIPPGNYDIYVEMVGYERQIIKAFRVSVNRTSSLDIKLRTAIIEGQTIEIKADKFAARKDQTSSMRTVSSDQIDVLPVENIGQVISMQAGVVNGHFRGGRSNEVSYLIDGLPVTDVYGGEGRAVDVEADAIEDLEVITGTFNAEYGRAMSGMVNQVIKDGDQKFNFSFSSALGNYYTSHNNIFTGLKNSEIARNQDYKVQLSGPIYKDKLTFFTNVRYQDNKGYLNGIRRFEVDDFSDYSSYDPTRWESQHSGDGKYVPMNGSLNLTFLGKIGFKITNNLRSSLLYSYNEDRWDGYSHAYKYNPDGMASAHRNSNMIALSLNHTLSNTAFYEIKLSHLNNYDGYYLYKNALDPRYISDIFSANGAETGFLTGGQDKSYGESWQRDFNAKFDLTWQITSKHAIKTGFLYTEHDLENRSTPIFPDTVVSPDSLGEIIYTEDGKRDYYNYHPFVYESGAFADIYKVNPVELSAYIQDKMEYDDLVINLGVRFDYFDPNITYASQPRNPDRNNPDRFYLKDSLGNALIGPDSLPIPDPEMMSSYPKADTKIQISPRIGLAYQLGKKAVLHFSYGHFFQMPPMYALYQNNTGYISTTPFSTTMGNPQLKAQKTVQYEIGLWQELMEGMGLEVTLFYRDIYDLLSTKTITTYNNSKYGLYSNKDYGNARGLELKYDLAYSAFRFNINYTLQYTRGNADNPLTTFSRAGANIDPINKLIPMSWDQRHTFNATVGYYQGDLGMTMIGYYSSGAPYTWSPTSINPMARVNLYPNNSSIPSSYSVDFSGYYNITLFNDFSARFELSIYNLLDRLNPAWVYGSTGQPYTTIIEETDRGIHRSDFTKYEDRIKNPTGYSAPRMIKIGLGINL
jgi:outer membrane receptor protein involved in Fe transport